MTVMGNLFFYRGSVLATDPKGELANKTAARRVALGQDVYVLDPFGQTEEDLKPLRARYNPLSVLKPDSDTLAEDAELIADAIVIVGERDPHWDESAKGFLQGLMLHVSVHPRYDGRRDLIAVNELIRMALVETPGLDPDEDGPRFVIEAEMAESAELLSRHSSSLDVAEVIDRAARDFYEKPDRERASVLSSLRRHTRFLGYRAMRRVLTGNDFDLGWLKRNPEGTSVYLCLPASRMAMCAPWLRIFVNQLLDAMEREKRKPAAPVIVCLDEFPVLGYMRQLEDAAGQIASYGVKLWVIIQDWGQGLKLYGERWETFTGNAGIIQVFGVGDVKTAEYVSRRLGKTPVEVSRQSEVGPEAAKAGLTGRTLVTEMYDLLSPDEVMRQFSRSDRLKRQLVIWTGHHPMVLQRVEYFDPKGPLAGLAPGLG